MLQMGKKAQMDGEVFLKSLIERGLRRVFIVVHDDFPGLSKLVLLCFLRQMIEMVPNF